MIVLFLDRNVGFKTALSSAVRGAIAMLVAVQFGLLADAIAADGGRRKLPGVLTGTTECPPPTRAPPSTAVPGQLGDLGNYGRCTIPRSPNGTPIYYGEAAPDEISTVAVRFTNARGVRDLCSGVVIDHGALLTAGHCACDKDYKLVFGSSVNDTADPRPERIDIIRKRIFPGYDCQRKHVGQPGLDYALMLFDPSDLNQGRSTYEIPVVKSPAEIRQGFHTFSNIGLKVVSLNMRVVGYGRTETYALGERRQAFVPVHSWFCAERWAIDLNCEPFTEIALSERGNGAFRADGRNTDTCGGDSGGPVFAMTHDIDERTGKIRVHNYLVAITSRGMKVRRPNESLPCGGGGIYEVVSRRSVQDWLTRFGVRFRVQ